jgi:hypothetical protein
LSSIVDRGRDAPSGPPAGVPRRQVRDRSILPEYDGFWEETLIYIPSVINCREGREGSAHAVIGRRKAIELERRKKWD